MTANHMTKIVDENTGEVLVRPRQGPPYELKPGYRIRVGAKEFVVTKTPPLQSLEFDNAPAGFWCVTIFVTAK